MTITKVPAHQYAPSWQRCQRAFGRAVTRWQGTGKREVHPWWQWGTPHHVSSWSPWQAVGSQGSPSCSCPGEKPHFTAIQSTSSSVANTHCSARLDISPHRDSCCPPDPDLPLDYSDKRNIFLIPAMKFLSSPSNCWKPFTFS